MESQFKPYIAPEQNLPELTMKALILGVIMAVILGGANAYLGLKAGMTVAATFPAAVIAMAVLRFFKGNILEENIARTTGAVGEALAAGAIFTIPAFLLGGDNALWPDFSMMNYVQGTLLLLIGGVLGVLFVILLRKTFMQDATLPFPESVACTEIVKAGQGGSSGAGLVFGSMGLAAAIEFLKNGNGIPIIGEKIKGLFAIGGSSGGGSAVGGTFPFETPSASPAFLGVGFIIGPKLAAITFAGGVFGWLFLMPLILVFASQSGQYPDLWAQVTAYVNNEPFKGETITIDHFLGDAGVLSGMYGASIKKVAIGAMIVGAFFTLFRMRKNLIGGMKSSFASLSAGSGGEAVPRTEQDIAFGKVVLMILIFVGAMFGVYYWLTSALGVSLVTTIVMLIMGFLFAAVAGFLVSVIGSSSNPISGLTLSTLLIAAGLLVLLGMKGRPGVIAVLGVAAVVCCVAGVAGDMIQDWKVGHNLGATPWRMEVSGLIGVVAASLVLVPIILLLHKSGGGIGSEGLSAPQAGLMHSTATGIIGGTMPWAYIIIGMLFAVALILVGVPSPMLIAVGMYLPFTTTAAIFAGGVIRWIADQLAQRKFGQSKSVLEQVENRGLLVASGLVAGEAMVGIVLAGIVASNTKIFCGAGDWGKHLQGKLHCMAQTPSWFHAKALGVMVILGLAIYMISLSLKGVKAAPEATPPTDGAAPPSGDAPPPATAPDVPPAAPPAVPPAAGDAPPAA